MQNSDNTGGTKEVNVSVQKNLLDHFPLRTITTTRHGSTICSLAGTLLGALVNASDDIELPVGHVVQGNTQGHFIDGRVQQGHMTLQLPESVQEHDRIIPTILAGGVTSIGTFELYILASGRRQLAKSLRTAIGNQRDGEVGVIVRSSGDFGFIILFLGLGSIIRGQKVFELLGLFLGKILIERTNEMEGVVGGVILCSRVQLEARTRNEEVRPESSIVLNRLGNLDHGIDFTSVTIVPNSEVLLLHD